MLPALPNDAFALLIAQRPLLANLRSGMTIIKIGGSIQDDAAQVAQIAAEIATLAALGAQICLVHGGGKAISAATRAAGIEPRFVRGQRYTDAHTLAVAEHVLAHTVNAELCGALAAAGARPAALHSLGTCVLHARLLTGPGEETGDLGLAGDLGLVGEVATVRTDVLLALAAQGLIPVIGPIATAGTAHSPSGKLNINADLAAGAVAAALSAARFILLSDTPGIRRVATDADTVISVLSQSEIETLRASGAIDGGMLPKVQACQMALAVNPACHIMIADGRQSGGLLSAILAPERALASRVIA